MTIKEQEKRDKQFEYINKLRSRPHQENFPEISIDTKKKELIGNFKNAGTRYKRVADLTNDHDFLSYGLGKAALRSICKNKSQVCPVIKCIRVCGNFLRILLNC